MAAASTISIYISIQMPDHETTLAVARVTFLMICRITPALTGGSPGIEIDRALCALCAARLA